MRLTDRVTVVILTCNRVNDLLRAVEHAKRLPEAPSIIVVDNGTADRIRGRFADVEVGRLSRNIGAAPPLLLRLRIAEQLLQRYRIERLHQVMIEAGLA